MSLEQDIVNLLQFHLKVNQLSLFERIFRGEAYYNLKFHFRTACSIVSQSLENKELTPAEKLMAKYILDLAENRLRIM